jgi:nitrite reductase/ring-hydroxylating ferredoxin subunit
VLVEVAKLDELPDREVTPVRLEGREIVLARLGDAVYAVHGICPHMNQSFVLGQVRGRVSGRPGDPQFDLEEPVITCPWHQFEYQLVDGRCVVDKRLRIRTFEVVLDDGKVFVRTKGET